MLDGLKETVLDEEASDGKCWNAQIKSTSTPSAKVRHRYRLRASCCTMERCWRKRKNKNSRTSCLKQGSGCIARNVLLTNYTFPSFISYDNTIFVSCTTVKHDWRWANKHITHNTKQRNCILENAHHCVAWQPLGCCWMAVNISNPWKISPCHSTRVHVLFEWHHSSLGGTLRCDRLLSLLEIWAGI